jgi:hypothetical protein
LEVAVVEAVADPLTKALKEACVDNWLRRLVYWLFLNSIRISYYEDFVFIVADALMSVVEQHMDMTRPAR